MNDVASLTIETHAVTISCEGAIDQTPQMLISIWVDHDDTRQVDLRMDPVVAAAFAGAVAQVFAEQKMRFAELYRPDEPA